MTGATQAAHLQLVSASRARVKNEHFWSISEISSAGSESSVVSSMFVLQARFSSMLVARFSGARGETRCRSFATEKRCDERFGTPCAHTEPQHFHVQTYLHSYQTAGSSQQQMLPSAHPHTIAVPSCETAVHRTDTTSSSIDAAFLLAGGALVLPAPL